MITDKYNIDGTDSAQNAIEEMARLAEAECMDAISQRRVRQLAGALVEFAAGLDEVVETHLWLETKTREAVVHVQADCVVDVTEEQKLKELASDGKNTERHSLWGKIKGLFEEMAISDNEELRTTGYVPDMEYGGGTYPVLWTFAPYTLGAPMKESWNNEAAEKVECLADNVEVGFASDEVHVAAHIRY